MGTQESRKFKLGRTRLQGLFQSYVTWNLLKNDVDLRDFDVEQWLYYGRISDILTKNVFLQFLLILG